jgi:hypothetical protein
MDVMMLHRCLIPDDEIGMSDEVSQIRVLPDMTTGGFMDVDRDFENGMSSAATLEKKRGDARGSDADHNLLLTTKVMTEGVVDKGFHCATWAIKE